MGKEETRLKMGNQQSKTATHLTYTKHMHVLIAYRSILHTLSVPPSSCLKMTSDIVLEVRAGGVSVYLNTLQKRSFVSPFPSSHPQQCFSSLIPPQNGFVGRFIPDHRGWHIWRLVSTRAKKDFPDQIRPRCRPDSSPVPISSLS